MGRGQPTLQRPSEAARPRRRTRSIAAICRNLETRYGTPSHGNKTDPFDELIYIVLSQMTTAPSFGRVFDRLKAVVGEWASLLSMPARDLAALISDAGLSGQKSVRIKAIASRLATDYGSVTLEPLHAMSDHQAEEYLTSLPGVGIKSAKCVLLYSLGRRVLPVDTHVARVSRRLGLLPADAVSSADVHAHLEAVVGPAFRYSFHVNAIALGRDTCRAPTPKCRQCVLRNRCPSRLN